MATRFKAFAAAVCIAASGLGEAAPACAAPAKHYCPIGAYELSDGATVDIAPSEGNSLRWRRFDGTSGALTNTWHTASWTSLYGWTGRPDGLSVHFSDCQSGRIEFAGLSGRRREFKVSDTSFSSHDTKLVGRLVMPQGRAIVPIVVLLQGSEHDSALTFNALQRLLPAEGVGAFVFDKRGTGKSQGTYSQDFELLADDAVAALREARRLAGKRTGRIGYQAGSQGGWVAPLAANRSSVDFVIVSFGLAVSVIDEDQQEVAIEMREKGHTAQEIAEAQQVASAAEAVFASGFTSGFAEFDAVRAKYSNAPWYKDLHGNYTYALLPYSEAQLRAMAPKFKWGTPFHYDPMPALRATKTHQLWILGGEDYEAPSEETSRRLKLLIAEGLHYTLAVYPQAEHGMTLFESTAGGERLSTRYAPDYFRMMRDFARNGVVRGTYGDASIYPPLDTSATRGAAVPR